MIHPVSGEPIKYQKGIETERGLKKVHKDEIVMSTPRDITS
jgi:hypothetical protein